MDHCKDYALCGDGNQHGLFVRLTVINVKNLSIENSTDHICEDTRQNALDTVTKSRSHDLI